MHSQPWKRSTSTRRTARILTYASRRLQHLHTPKTGLPACILTINSGSTYMLGLPLPPTNKKLVRHRMEQYVDAERVAARRELLKERRVLTLPLPGVRDVRIVGHEHDDPSPR